MNQHSIAFKSALRAIEWLVVALIAWYLALILPEYLNDQNDFNEYFYHAGWRLAHRLSPYDFVSPFGDRFMYPPWFALLMVPLSLLPVRFAAVCWLGINLGMLAVSVVLATRLCGVKPGIRRTILLVLVLALSPPAQAHFAYGQHALLPAAAAFGAVLALKSNRPWLAGCLLMIAASKPQLVFLLVPGLSLWEWKHQKSGRVFAGFTLSVFAALLVCLLITPVWVSDLFKPFPSASGTPISTRLLLISCFGAHTAIETIFFVVLALGSIGLMWLWFRPEATLLETASITLAATPVLSPHAQLHDYVILILPLLLVSSRLYRAAGTARPWSIAPVAIASWVIVSLHGWTHQLIEREWMWALLRTWIGEESVAYLWEQSKWNWRFIAMLLPLGLLAILGRQWAMHSFETRGRDTQEILLAAVIETGNDKEAIN